MMGTLATVLARRKIPTFQERFRADVEGDIEDVDGVMRITKIRVKYTLKVPKGKTEDAREAMKVYERECPAAMSVKAAIAISDSADITELPE